MSHAQFSPSSAHRWLECHASVREAANYPDPDSVYAREGTFAHTIAARLLLSGAKAKTAIGETDGEFTFDAEMAADVQVYLHAVRGILTMEGGELLVEQQVRINDDVYGTADAVVICGSELYVVDLKMGRGQFVSAVDNEQLLTYGLATLLTFADKCREVERVHVHIVQPRIDSDELWRRHSATAEFLQTEWASKLLTAVELAKRPDAAYKAGEHCKFCPAKAQCPELRQQALATAQAVFPDGTVDTAVKPPSPRGMTPQQLSAVLDKLDIVESWMKAVREHAFEEARQGRLPGWKVVPKAGNRAWRNEALVAPVLQNMGIDPMAPPKLLSPAQAEKALAKLHNKKTAEAAIEQLAHKPITGSSLVPESDPRPAIALGSVFPSET